MGGRLQSQDLHAPRHLLPQRLVPPHPRQPLRPPLHLHRASRQSALQPLGPGAEGGDAPPGLQGVLVHAPPPPRGLLSLLLPPLRGAGQDPRPGRERTPSGLPFLDPPPLRCADETILGEAHRRGGGCGGRQGRGPCPRGPGLCGGDGPAVRVHGPPHEIRAQRDGPRVPKQGPQHQQAWRHKAVGVRQGDGEGGCQVQYRGGHQEQLR
mmetsp:Transcript_63676/g.201356  ORF Transcript_63676/g.201356 Transcript_63676/m.201356 type:complete len:209 (+) Transcript_63676:257-883(+)